MSAERHGLNTLDPAEVDGGVRTFNGNKISAIMGSVVRIYLCLSRVSCREGQGEGAVGKGNSPQEGRWNLSQEETSIRDGKCNSLLEEISTRDEVTRRGVPPCCRRGKEAAAPVEGEMRTGHAA